jgi:hypothetical protein
VDIGLSQNCFMDEMIYGEAINSLGGICTQLFCERRQFDATTGNEKASSAGYSRIFKYFEA